MIKEASKFVLACVHIRLGRWANEVGRWGRRRAVVCLVSGMGCAPENTTIYLYCHNHMLSLVDVPLSIFSLSPRTQLLHSLVLGVFMHVDEVRAVTGHSSAVQQFFGRTTQWL